MGILDFFSREAGQARRKALEDAISYYIPPELAGPLGLLNELNPVTSVERAGDASGRMLNPSLPFMDRVGATGEMLSNVAGVVAPAMVAGRAGMTAAQALEEGLLGISNSPAGMAASNMIADDFSGLRLPGSPTDPAAARGQEIMGLLTSRRGADVTDDMLDLGDPVQNARLNEYLYNNYDLPMDALSRMARRAEIGGGRDVYSGTGDDFTAFDSKAVYATPNPDLAYTYAPSDGGVVMPLTMRAKHGSPVVDAGGANWNKLNPSMRVGGDNALPIPDEIAPHNAGLFNEWPMSTRDYEQAAKQGGFSGVTFDNIVDVGGYISKYYKPGELRGAQTASLKRAFEPSTVEARFYPNQVRSTFARFDPRLSHLRNLNAGIAGALGLGGLLSLPQEEQY